MRTKSKISSESTIEREREKAIHFCLFIALSARYLHTICLPLVFFTNITHFSKSLFNNPKSNLVAIFKFTQQSDVEIGSFLNPGSALMVINSSSSSNEETAAQKKDKFYNLVNALRVN